MKKPNHLLKSFFVILISLFSLTSNAQQLAFPGAEGHGRYTTGGRGGAVYIVNSLLDDGSSGTLRWAINQSGARTIVFAVSGTIYLNSVLNINNDNITIAGQTAPAPGICISDYTTQVKASNVIIRYLRFRLGSKYLNEDDAFGGRNEANIIIDHCSMSWSIDECASFYDNENFTMQWCILAESLWDSGHPKGAHGYGGIWGGMKASFHHNLLSSHTSRNPRFCGARYHLDTQETEIVDFRNNVIFNWGFNSTYGGESGHQNMVNNYYKAGPATETNKKNRIVEINQLESDPLATPGEWYIAGNYVDGYPAITADNWAGGVQGSDAGTAGVRATVPFDDAGITTETAEEAYASVMARVGAKLPLRDAFDQRIVNEVQSGTCAYGDSYGANSGIIDNEANVGGVPVLEENTGPADTDSDGMPDDWETANGLNPSDPSDRNNINAQGYTMLEAYMSGVIQDITGNALTINDGGHATLTLNPAGGNYLPGTVVNISITPKPGYAFASWSGDLSSTTANISVTMDSSITLTANYTIVSIAKYTLSTATSGNGIVIGGGTYDDGTTKTVVALAGNGYLFDGWSGDLTGYAMSKEILIDRDKSITATFIPSSITGKKIAYITDPASEFYANDTKILKALKNDANFTVTEIDATLTGNDFSTYDLILISEVPGSASAIFPELKGLNKPVVMMKVHAYKGTVWDFATAGYGQHATATNIVVENLAHPIFRNIQLVNTNEIQVLDAVAGGKGLTYMDPTQFLNLTGSATSLAYVKGTATQSCVIQIPSGSVVNGTTIPQNFIQIGINASSFAKVSESGVKLILNACYYQLGESFETTTNLSNCKGASSFSCYPTLVQDVFNINYPGVNKATISITSLMGQTMLQKELKNNTETINLNQLPSGIYFCTITTENKRESIKIIKE